MKSVKHQLQGWQLHCHIVWGHFINVLQSCLWITCVLWSQLRMTWMSKGPLHFLNSEFYTMLSCNFAIISELHTGWISTKCWECMGIFVYTQIHSIVYFPFDEKRTLEHMWVLNMRCTLFLQKASMKWEECSMQAGKNENKGFVGYIWSHKVVFLDCYQSLSYKN